MHGGPEIVLFRNVNAKQALEKPPPRDNWLWNSDSSFAPRRAATAAAQTPPPLPACRSGGIGSRTSTKTLRSQPNPTTKAGRLRATAGTGDWRASASRAPAAQPGSVHGARGRPAQAGRPNTKARTARAPAAEARGGGGAHLAQLPAVGGGGLHRRLPALAQPPLQLLQPLAQTPQLRRAAATAQALLLGLIVRHLRSPLRRVRTWVT